MCLLFHLLAFNFVNVRTDIKTYDQLCSKRRLDSMLWLQLKMRLIEGLSLMTPLYGATDCKKMCLSTLEQSQIFNASEVTAWLSLKSHVLDLSSKDGPAVEVSLNIITLHNNM